MSDSFKMYRIHTSAIAAQVVYFKAARNRGYEILIRHAMSEARPSV
jgi:hypothetical protein